MHASAIAKQLGVDRLGRAELGTVGTPAGRPSRAAGQPRSRRRDDGLAVEPRRHEPAGHRAAQQLARDGRGAEQPVELAHRRGPRPSSIAPSPAHAMSSGSVATDGQPSSESASSSRGQASASGSGAPESSPGPSPAVAGDRSGDAVGERVGIGELLAHRD